MSTITNFVISKANEYARNHGLRTFSVYQGQWSAACRDLERDILPMCRDEGMGIVPWGALGGGNFKTEEQRHALDARDSNARDNDVKASRALEVVSRRLNTSVTSIALAYVMHKAPYVFPVISGRKVDHLKVNIEALTIELSDDDMKEIESSVPFDLGFPHTLLWGKTVPDVPQRLSILDMAGTFDYVPQPQV
jgi:aryl-alcohol dehydrogenase-like predicted oxidoreductase